MQPVVVRLVEQTGDASKAAVRIIRQAARCEVFYRRYVLVPVRVRVLADAKDSYRRRASCVNVRPIVLICADVCLIDIVQT